MKNYLKNIFRAILKNKGSYFGAISVITLGIMIYVSMTDVMSNLTDCVNAYYERYKFSDVMTVVEAIPASELKKLENIDGIEKADGRLGKDVRFLVEDSENVVMVHLMSYSSDNESLNQIKVNDGGKEISSDAIFLGNKMVEFYGFEIGQEVKLIINGKTEKFILAGNIQSPEYIYAIPPTGGLLPDSETYDIACIGKDKMEELFNSKNVYNELGFALKDGYEYTDVKYNLETKLSAYGLSSITSQEKQFSNYMLQSEFNQLKTMIIVLPALFLLISVFMLYIILKRMIDQDRTLIGTIKALGYTDFEIFGAYMKQGIITGFLGAVLGAILSFPMGYGMFAMYAMFFNLPYGQYKMYPQSMITGVILAVATGIVATYFGIKEILNINPAEAMRAAAPSFNGGFKLPKFLNKILSTGKKIAIRSVFRNKIRSAIIAFAIAVPFGFIAVLSSFDTIIDQMFFSQFTKIQMYDLKVGLDSYAPYSKAVDAVVNIDGVSNIEGVAEYSVNIKHENFSEYSSLIGLNPDSEVYKIMDNEDVYYKPRNDGLIMNSITARKLNVKKGDIVEVESSYLTIGKVYIPVAEVIEESFGSGVYMDIDAIKKYFGKEKAVNQIVFNVEPEKMETVKKTLLDAGKVILIADKNKTLSNYESSMETMVYMIGVFEFVSVLAAVILIYNISNITMRERKTEFGTMSILGNTFGEIAEIISFEQLINFIAGVIMGYPMTMFIKWIVEIVVASDAYTVNVEVAPIGYIKAFFMCMSIVILSVIAVLKNIKNIELTDVLKERE